MNEGSTIEPEQQTKYLVCLKQLIQEAGWTALMFAAKEGDMKILQQLITAGADVNVVDKVGDMFVMVSVGWINCNVM